MPESVHANIDDLKKLQKAVDKAGEEVADALKKLQRALDQADWRDSARQAFEAQLKSASSSVRQTTQRLGDLKPILNREIQALQEYLRRR